MTSASENILSELGNKLVEYIRRQTTQTIQFVSIAPLSGGACQDNYRLDVKMDGCQVSFVVRSDAPTSLLGSLSRQEEYLVIRAAHQNGVNTPKTQWLGFELMRDGAWTYVMDWLDGESIGRRILSHPVVQAEPERLVEALVDNLAKIHSIEKNALATSIRRPPFRGDDPFEDAFEMARTMLDTLPSRRPASEWILSWLRRNRPEAGRQRLLHGDFRLGNFMVDSHGALEGILDWEFAHWGDPYEDLGWLCVRDWRFGHTNRAAGGLVTRRALCEAYASYSGHPVDFQRLHFWEVFGNLRWGLSAAHQGERYRNGGDFELLGIPRRAVEMEYEALRLIKAGY